MAEVRAAGDDVAVGVVALVAAGASAVALGTGAPLVSLLPILVLGAAGMALLAVQRMAWFVLAALVIRSSLDATKLGRRAPLGLDPAQALAVVLLGCAVVWLVQRWRSGAWVRLWWTTRFGLAFLAAAALSLAGSPDSGVGVLELSRVSAAMLMLVVLNQLLGQGERPLAYLYALFAAAVVPIGLGIYQLATSSSLRSIGGFRRVESTFQHPNPFAIFCGMVLIMAVAVLTDVPRSYRLPIALVGIGSAVALIFTYTRGAWLAVVLGLVVVGFKHRPAMLVLGIVACATLYLMVPSVSERIQETAQSEQVGNQPNSLSWRFEYWKDALRLSEDSRITGIGIKGVAAESARGKQPHNDYIRTFVETGVLGSLAFVAFSITALVETSKAAKRAARGLPRAVAVGAQASVAAFIVFAMSANVISQVVVLWYLALVIALGISASRIAAAMPARPVEHALVAS